VVNLIKCPELFAGKINLKETIFTFCLDAKSNKKIKAPEKMLKFISFRYNERCSVGLQNRSVLLKNGHLNKAKTVRCLTLHSTNFLTPFF
jgi:hypothetical protein